MCYKKEKYKICIYCYLNIAWSISIDDISNKICFIYFGSADDCTYISSYVHLNKSYMN